MRHEKIIDLDQGRLVTVREMMVADVRRISAQLEAGGVDFMGKALDGDFTPLLALLGDCISIDLDIDTLSFSEIEQVRVAFMEANNSFFGRAAIENLIAAASLSLMRSIAPAASSSSAAMPASPAMDGPSSSPA